MEIRSNFDPARRYPQADITRPNRETIARETPEPASSDDVRANQARQRHEAQQLAKRIKNARQKVKAEDEQHAKRIENARNKHEESVANRIRLARERAVQDETRAESARSDSVEIAATPVDISERAHNARLQQQQAVEHRQRYEATVLGPRAQAARDKLSLSDTTLRLQADASSAGSEESRIEVLRRRVENASLNTDELIAKAAFKLLSGD